jgi:hypothetical protein
VVVQRDDVGRYVEERPREPSMLYSRHQVTTDVNIDLLRKDSIARDFSASETNIQAGISGMKDFIEVRSKMRLLKNEELLDFVDYFSKKDGEQL